MGQVFDARNAVEATSTTRAPTGPEVSDATVGRREVLRRPLAVAVVAVGGGLLLSGCDFSSAPFDRRIHLLKRCSYGARAADRDRITAIGEDAWLTEQLDPSTLDTSALDTKLAALPALSMDALDLFNNYPGSDYKNASRQLQLAAAMRASESPAQLHERMVEFWSDHFNVPLRDRPTTLYKIVEDRTVIRPFALGTFKDLLVASATSPAMLRYLDNYSSKIGAINENYGRELLELHTVGAGNYTEADVVATARLLTGWSINPSKTFEFKYPNNDPAPLTILGWNRPTSGNGLTHGIEFLRWLAVQPVCAQHVCTKIARRFVSDRPDPGLVNAMTSAWLAHDSAIGPVIRAMVAHPAFDASANQKFRRPWDYATFVLRALRATIAPTTATSELRRLEYAFDELGQLPFSWPAPNGYPDVEGAWLNTGGLTARWNWTGDVIGRAFTPISYDTTALRASLSGQTTARIYDLVGQYLMLESVTNAGRSILNRQLGWTDGRRPTERADRRRASDDPRRRAQHGRRAVPMSAADASRPLPALVPQARRGCRRGRGGRGERNGHPRRTARSGPARRGAVGSARRPLPPRRAGPSQHGRPVHRGGLLRRTPDHRGAGGPGAPAQRPVRSPPRDDAAARALPVRTARRRRRSREPGRRTEATSAPRTSGSTGRRESPPTPRAGSVATSARLLRARTRCSEP